MGTYSKNDFRNYARPVEDNYVEEEALSHSYSFNDFRDYLEHKEGGSKYDWSSGKNPSDYNHDYYEKNKERILAQRAKRTGKSIEEVEKESIRDFGGHGVGYKAKKDNTTGEKDEDYEDTDDWSDEMTDDEKKNVSAHNKTVEENIAAVTKTVHDFIERNKDKLSPDEVSNLMKSLDTQIDIAREQAINTKNSDDREYVMNLRKKARG